MRPGLAGPVPKVNSAPVPASEAVAAVLVHLRDEEPMDPAELAAHERQWRAAQDEFLAVERADARQDRLL